MGPLSAELSETELSLVLTDGTTCRADWRQSPNGRFDACGPGFGYAVTEVANPNLLRKFWVEAATALGAAGAVPPMAEVVITDASGRDHLFTKRWIRNRKQRANLILKPCGMKKQQSAQ